MSKPPAELLPLPRPGEVLLSVRNLTVAFDTEGGPLEAVKDVSFDVGAGETVGIVGESGSGKTSAALALVGLLPQPPARVVSGSVLLDGIDLLHLSEDEITSVRGRLVGFIFQDPMVALNPVLRVGRQIAEALAVHDSRLHRSEARRRTLELLNMVHLPNPDDAFDRFPHEMSGGMRQRALIAMAVANRPNVIIADEPTTALDVTVQAQVLETLREVQERVGSAMILISHDLGLIAEVADRILVMYAGRVVETGDVETVLDRPRHPYTAGLLQSAPSVDFAGGRLPVIPGRPPDPREPMTACPFQPRCSVSRGRARCVRETPELEPVGEGHAAACHFHDDPMLLRAGS